VSIRSAEDIKRLSNAKFCARPIFADARAFAQAPPATRAAVLEFASMPDFRVAKLRVPVKVLVCDRVQRSDVFLTPVAANHDGSETLLDLLNGRDEYLPVERKGEMACIPRDAIEVAWISPGAETADVELSPPTEQRVRITLRSGRQLRGSMRYSRHPDSSRLVDYLNGSPQFVALHQARQLALVNRGYIAFIDLETQARTAKRRSVRVRRSRVQQRSTVESLKSKGY